MNAPQIASARATTITCRSALTCEADERIRAKVSHTLSRRARTPSVVASARARRKSHTFVSRADARGERAAARALLTSTALGALTSVVSATDPLIGEATV